ncbi:hypothetical protein MT325_m723R [Paramecium bursaria chlorella virus MT325]|uniref:Uncharacterized protein m723R n=1 Tax=Paramecium bursaria Chlorella virus MT325 TaxID=346932 RepID=A7IVA3_PBCVM|nr:hypothetical protein MT325_m723R [Paramecium bursaria chlorella virus MT325]
MPIPFHMGRSTRYTNRSMETKGVSRGRRRSFLRIKMLYAIWDIMTGAEYTMRLPKVRMHVLLLHHLLVNTVGPMTNHAYKEKKS